MPKEAVGFVFPRISMLYNGEKVERNIEVLGEKKKLPVSQEIRNSVVFCYLAGTWCKLARQKDVKLASGW